MGRAGPRRRRGRDPWGTLRYGVTQPQVSAVPVPTTRHTVLIGHRPPHWPVSGFGEHGWIGGSQRQRLSAVLSVQVRPGGQGPPHWLVPAILSHCGTGGWQMQSEMPPVVTNTHASAGFGQVPPQVAVAP